MPKQKCSDTHAQNMQDYFDITADLKFQILELSFQLHSICPRIVTQKLQNLEIVGLQQLQ